MNGNWFEQYHRREKAAAARFWLGVFIAVVLLVALASTLATVLQP